MNAKVIQLATGTDMSTECQNSSSEKSSDDPSLPTSDESNATPTSDGLPSSESNSSDTKQEKDHPPPSQEPPTDPSTGTGTTSTQSDTSTTPPEVVLQEQPTPSPDVPEYALHNEAMKLFGPDYPRVKQAAGEFNIDFDTYVIVTSKKLGGLEAVQNELIEQFQKDIGPDLWPCIGHAFGVAHTVENARRGLLGLLNTSAVEGQTAEVVTNLFSGLSNASMSFVSATMAMLLGETVAGFDRGTVQKRILEPFNKVMDAKRAIFDMLGEANQDFSNQISTAFQGRLQADAERRQAALADLAPEVSAPTPGLTLVERVPDDEQQPVAAPEQPAPTDNTDPPSGATIADF